MAGFEPGNKLAGSRKGIPNKRSAEVQAIMDEAGHCPIEKLIYLGRVAEARFGAEIELVESGRYSPMESNASAYLKMAIDANKELAAFITPKLKAIERTVNNPLEGMSPEQRLEAMKQAVAFLESDIKKGESGPSAT